MLEVEIKQEKRQGKVKNRGHGRKEVKEKCAYEDKTNSR